MGVSATDRAGIVGSFSSTASYIFDFTAPVFSSLTVDPVTLTPTDFTDPTLAFLATDTVGVDHYQVQVNGGGYTTQTSPLAITASAVSINTVNVRAYDAAGNVTTQTVSFYPSVIITAPTTISNTGINDTTIRVVGPNDITSVTATIDGVGVSLTCPDLAAVDNDITCTVDGGVPTGGTLVVSAADTNGPGAASTQAYTYDTTAPAITPSTPTSISQTAIADSSFVVTDANGIFLVTFTGATNTISCAPVLPTLTNTTTCTGSVTASGVLTVNTTDTAGNTNSTTHTYYIDAVAPTISAFSPVAGIYNAAQAVTFTVSDTNSGIIPGNVSITGGTGASCSAVDAQNVSCSVNVNTTGTLSVSATDNAGNVTTT